MKSLSFDEFPPSSYEEWKALVAKELAGKSLESLNWKNENGFETGPYFTESDAHPMADINKDWDICQSIRGTDLPKVNALLLQSLMGGAGAIAIDAKIGSAADLATVLQEINIAFVATHFLSVTEPLEFLQWLVKFCNEKNIDTKTLRGSVQCDLIGKDKPGEVMIPLAEFAVKHFSLFHVFSVNADKIHRMGGSQVHELAYALSCGNEYLYRLTSAGFSVDDASAMLQFNFETGSSYFPEIAKYQALRDLWSTVVKQYQPDHDCSGNCFVHATTSLFFPVKKDPYNNLLRLTTQAMSAVIGGADSVNVWPFDESFSDQNENSLRLSRNIQHLLKEESYFVQHRQAAKGSHYLEKMMDEISTAAWKLFQEIESRGGVAESENYLEELAVAQGNQKRHEIENGQRVLVGLNKYPGN